MVSSAAMAASQAEKQKASTSELQEELEIEYSMRNAAIIDHQNEPVDNLGQQVLNVFNPADVAGFCDMIHVEVPGTTVLVERDDGTSKYVAYNLHVNGWYHSSVRFSSLYELSELIKSKFPLKYKGPEFPPKKVFKLDSKGIDDRRQKICKYFQAVVQHPEIARHYLVEKKLLSFQVDSYRVPSNYATMDVFMGNGEKVVINCDVHDNSTEVLKLVAEKLGNPYNENIPWHFGLFACKSRNKSHGYSVDPETFDPLLVRLFRNFESPFISLSIMNQMNQMMNGDYHFACVRKVIWDPRIEESLMRDPLLTDLLYKQALQDFRQGHFGTIKYEFEIQLRTASRQEDKEAFLHTCHQLPSYSFEILADCITDYPKPGFHCSVKFGRRQIVLTHKDDKGEEVSNIYRATRIRVWRVTQTNDLIMFQFEYLMARDVFEWITLQTDQAILMSLLLQSIGAEILYEHNNLTIEQRIIKEQEAKGVVRDMSKPRIILKNAVGDDPHERQELYRSRNNRHTLLKEMPRTPTNKEITNEDL